MSKDSNIAHSGVTHATVVTVVIIISHMQQLCYIFAGYTVSHMYYNIAI